MNERPYFSTEDGGVVPGVTVDEMREVDRVAVAQTGPSLLQMMEHAGAELAMMALDLLMADAGDASWRDARVLVLAGSGSNGAGGVCAARHLANRGLHPVVVATRPPQQADGALGQQYMALAEAPARVIRWDEAFDVAEFDVVVDAVIGYGLDGDPRGAQMALIRATRAARGRVLSLDVPSGLNPDTGSSPGVAVRPDATLTLGLPKRGLRRENAGDLWLADLGIPPGVFARAGIAFKPFLGRAGRLRLRYPEPSQAPSATARESANS